MSDHISVDEIIKALKNLGLTIKPSGTKSVEMALGLTRQRVSQLVQEGILKKLARGKYDLLDCLIRYARYWRDIGEGKGYTDDKGAPSSS